MDLLLLIKVANRQDMVMTNDAQRLSERSVQKRCGGFPGEVRRRAMSLAKLHLTDISNATFLASLDIIIFSL